MANIVAKLGLKRLEANCKRHEEMRQDMERTADLP